MKKNSHATRAFVIAMIASVVFYAFVHQPWMRHTFLHRYTTEHITEYAIVTLFFWANTDLFLCFIRNRREYAAARYHWLPSREGIEPVENAQSLIYHAKAGPMPLHGTKMYRRVSAALGYINDRQSAVGFREYLQDLASRDADETYARYGFPRFVTGVLPILGLLGTVVHFGGALSGLSSDDLVSKVPQIVSGMGTAFNTTCAALSASTSAMLLRFLIERQEEAIVVQVNEYVEDELLNRFVADENEMQPVLDAIAQTNRALFQIERNTQSHALTAETPAQLESLITSLQAIAGSEKQLLLLQDRLAENLVILNKSLHMDEAVHGLTAAMHLLLARQNENNRTTRAA